MGALPEYEFVCVCFRGGVFLNVFYSGRLSTDNNTLIHSLMSLCAYKFNISEIQETLILQLNLGAEINGRCGEVHGHL